MAFVSRCEIYITTSPTGNTHLLHKETCEIVYDSILENKEKTKRYWERLMSAAQGVGSREERLISQAQEAKEERPTPQGREPNWREERRGSEGWKPSPKEVRPTPQGWEPNSWTECQKSKKQEPRVECQKPKNQESLPKEVCQKLKKEEPRPMEENQNSKKQESPIPAEGSIKSQDEPSPTEKRNYFTNSKETPIEKEIRMANEREEELRREKLWLSEQLLNKNNVSASIGVPLRNGNHTAKRTSLDNQAMSTFGTGNLRKVYYSSKESDKKAEMVSKSHSTALKKCVSLSNIPGGGLNAGCIPRTINKSQLPTPSRSSPMQRQTDIITPKPYTACGNKKGVMKKFIESHGRVIPTFSLTPVSFDTVSKSPEAVNNAKSKVTVETYSQHGRRPGYRSAENKIQMELEEMKKREIELRNERALYMGQSHPNLLDIMTDSDEEDVRLPTMGELRTALSNPNLLDTKPPVEKVPNKRRSALIEAWENRIRKEN